MTKDKKEEGSVWFLIIWVGVIAYLMYFEVYKKDTAYYLEKNYQLTIGFNYNGVIERKYVDKSNHNSPMVKFKDGTDTGIHPYFWGDMQVGDSISKVKGDSIIQVFRNGEKIVLDIAPYYEKAIDEQLKKIKK